MCLSVYFLGLKVYLKVSVYMLLSVTLKFTVGVLLELSGWGRIKLYWWRDGYVITLSKSTYLDTLNKATKFITSIPNTNPNMNAL